MLDIRDILSGDHRAGARMIRLIEENDPMAFNLLKQLYPYSGNAFIIGITGSPGAGKSTLIDTLIFEFRRLEKKVGVIAVDPTSPYSGGAILGDRLRMQRHATDKGVFIRSMASRGQKGGLSLATKDAVIVLDTMGHEIIMIETVGAGQGEFDIASLAHSVGIVSIPGTGDGIQAVKAGILETGDIFIVNKSDRPGADTTCQELAMMVDMRSNSRTEWTPKIIKTNALNGTGAEELAATFLSHFDFMKTNGLMDSKIKELDSFYFKSLLKDLTLKKILFLIEGSQDCKEMLKAIESHKIDPITAAEDVANKLCVLKT